MLYIFINQVSHVFYIKKGEDMHIFYQNSSNGGNTHFAPGEMTVQDEIEAGGSDMLAKFPPKIYNFSVLFDQICAKNIAVGRFARVRLLCSYSALTYSQIQCSFATAKY